MSKIQTSETRRLKEAAIGLERFVPFLLSPTAIHFSGGKPEGALAPHPDTWTCIFAFMNRVQQGDTACFSAEAPGCIGAVSYFGFGKLPTTAAAVYLSGRERLKRDASLAAAFYNEVQPLPAPGKHLLFQRLDTFEDEQDLQVVNLWVNAASLSRLHALANYDRAGNDNVLMPFSSGCQSIWTLPYKESIRNEPRAIAGSLDPTVRRFLPDDAISFSLPSGRFLEMCDNIEGSFLNR